jgi:hypothetical protein
MSVQHDFFVDDKWCSGSSVARINKRDLLLEHQSSPCNRGVHKDVDRRLRRRVWDLTGHQKKDYAEFQEYLKLLDDTVEYPNTALQFQQFVLVCEALQEHQPKQNKKKHQSKRKERTQGMEILDDFK